MRAVAVPVKHEHRNDALRLRRVRLSLAANDSDHRACFSSDIILGGMALDLTERYSMDSASSLTPEFQVGARITVNNEAGPRLARRQGVVIGSGKYRDLVRVTLDGAKSSMTLHRKYLSLVEA